AAVSLPRDVRVPWGKAFLPVLLGGGLVALFVYVDQVLAWRPVTEQLDAGQRILAAKYVRLWAPIATLALVALGALRVLNGYVAAKAPANAPARSLLVRFMRRWHWLLYRKSDPMRAADALRDLGEYEAAANLRLEAGFAGPAGDDFMSACLPLAAAQAYERARDHQRAIDAYVAGGAHDRAAKAALESGQVSEAAALFTSARMFDRAVDAYRKARKPEKASLVLEQAGRLKEAADELAQAFGDERTLKLQTAEQRREVTLRTADLYERAQKPLLAAKHYETAGDLARAADLYERGGAREDAARVAMQGKDFVRAVDLFEAAGKKEHVSRALAEGFLVQGRVLEAAQELEKVRDFERAAGIYEQAGELAAAARCIEASGDSALAADLHSRASDFAKAAPLYEKAFAWREAALAWHEVGDREREARAHERSGNPIRAAEILIAAKKDGEAVRVLSAVSEGSSDRSRASALLGDVHAAAGRHKDAVLAYAETLGDQAVVDASSAPRILRHADCLRALGRLEDASVALGRLRGSPFAPADLDSLLRGLAKGPANAPAPDDGRTVAMGSFARMGGALAAGTEIDRYRLLSSLGEGGFAWVYKAEHTFLKRTAALKVLKPFSGGDEDVSERFLEEGRAVAALKHPNLIEVYDCGRTPDGLLYMALEFVNGVSLRKLMKEKGPLPLGQAAKIGAGVLAGLACAHRAKIVHRDLKPENILIEKGDNPKVLDFGIAKVFHGTSATRAGAYLGTPRYSSPEQALGKEVGPAADQYAIGLLLYEMLAGRPPFESTTPLGYLTQHAQATPPHVATLLPSLPADLAAAIMCSLEKDPAARHQDVDAMRRIVANFLPAPSKRPPSAK
ncbi:protein kinase, partial [bacterium]|nr:protein kinase [bacterium]